MTEQRGFSVEWAILKLHPVLVQKNWNEFEPPGRKTPKTLAIPGQVLVKGDNNDALATQDATKYCSGTPWCINKMQWKRPNIYNVTQQCARHMSVSNESHRNLSST